jgi:hypothetical protein
LKRSTSSGYTQTEKTEYGVSKLAYQVITLLNCLGNVVEMVEANEIAEFECKRLFHDGGLGAKIEDQFLRWLEGS